MFTLIYLYECLPTHYTRESYGLIFGGFQLWYPVSLHDVRVFWSLSIVSPNKTSFGVWITEIYSQNQAVHYQLGAIAMWQWFQMCSNLLGFCFRTEISLRNLRLLALMLLPRDFFDSLLSLVNHWLLPNGQLSYPGIQYSPQRLVGPKYWVHFSFSRIHPDMVKGLSVVHTGVPLWVLSVTTFFQSTPQCFPAWMFAKKWEQGQLFRRRAAHLYNSFLL